MRMDSNSIIAAILHDVIEDTPTLKEQIAEQFGEEVAELVDGVSKLTQIDFRSKAEAQAENFRKMMLAMVKDIRVIIIKLADRLHNMRTLERQCTRTSVAAFARETMDIYAPIANRLGHLQDAPRAARPVDQGGLPDALPRARFGLQGGRRLPQGDFQYHRGRDPPAPEGTGIEATVKYRQKNIHSIYRKMKEKGSASRS